MLLKCQHRSDKLAYAVSERMNIVSCVSSAHVPVCSMRAARISSSMDLCRGARPSAEACPVRCDAQLHTGHTNLCMMPDGALVSTGRVCLMAGQDAGLDRVCRSQACQTVEIWRRNGNRS